MHALSRGGRAAAHPTSGRSSSSHALNAFCHGKMALMLQHHAQRQALLVATAAKKRFQDFDSDSLDLDGMDDKLGKYSDFSSPAAAAAAAAAAAKAPQQASVYTQQVPRPPGPTASAAAAPGAAAPPNLGRPVARQVAANYGYDDYGFDEGWGSNPTPLGGAGAGAGGGYMPDPYGANGNVSFPNYPQNGAAGSYGVNAAAGGVPAAGTAQYFTDANGVIWYQDGLGNVYQYNGNGGAYYPPDPNAGYYQQNGNAGYQQNGNAGYQQTGYGGYIDGNNGSGGYMDANGGYLNGSGGGGYANGNGTYGNGNGGGYANGNGNVNGNGSYAGSTGGYVGTAGSRNAASGGYMTQPGYGNLGNFGSYSGGSGTFVGWDEFDTVGGYGTGRAGGYGGGGYMSSRSRLSKQQRGLADWEEEVDEIDGEKPVVKVDKCYINGKSYQCNHGITVKEVFVLGSGAERNPLGTMSTSKAQALADDAKEDLLLLNPDASPPVARIIKWDKYKYELEKGAKEKKAKSTTIETKEVRMRPSTDSGDIETKLKSCRKFLAKGDRVKLVMKFEGREVQFKEQGKEVLLNFISELASVAKVEGPLNFKTGTYTILLSPAKAA